MTKHTLNPVKGGLYMAAMSAAIMAAGCVTNATRMAKVKEKMTALIEQNKFEEARNLEVKKNPGGLVLTDEEKAKNEMLPLVTKKQMEWLISQGKFDEARNLKLTMKGGGSVLTDEEKAKNAMLSLVDRAEAKAIANRIKQLREKVLAALENGDDEAARRHIYTFGITGQSRVDAALFLMKTGMLNSRVNPAAYARIGATAETACREAIDKGDFKSAIEAYKTIRLVMAYPDAVDTGLDDAAAEAVRQRCEKDGVEALVAEAKRIAYGITAPRDGYEKTDFVPDWTKVEQQLDVVHEALVNDDVPEKDAKRLADMLLTGIKAYFNDHATDEEMTTQELNDRLSSLKYDLYTATQDAINSALAKAAEEEAARLREFAREFAALVASEIDMEARAGAFVAAISDRVEPDVNRILADGARVLRLHLRGVEISPDDATSLLVAASYMGFGDVMSLALSLKADIDGTCPKDSFGRTPYLLAFQHGMKGNVRELLSKADRRKADAYGYNALHYAVRYGTASDVVDALDFGIDAKAAAKDGVTPLMVAARLNNAAFVQSLVALSDDKAADKDGYTALHYAIDAGSLPITKMLVTSGANPLAATKNGDTAIERAVMRPDEAILAYLLDDVKVDGKNLVPTKRATDWCVIHNKVLPLATLVSHGAEVTDRHLAAAVLIDMKDDVLDMVKYLVEIGCDVNAPEVHKAVNRRLGTQDANVIFNGEIPAKVTDSLSSMNFEANGKITTNAVSVTNRPASLGVVADPVVKFLLDNGYRSVDGEPRFIR